MSEETITIPRQTLVDILEHIQDANQYLEAIRPNPDELTPIYQARRDLGIAGLNCYQLLNPPYPVKPWEDPSRSKEDRETWREAEPISLPEPLGKVING